ncbi:PREDICTED: disintegrin and metalloproteinase domain-containing protein 32-like, partial [Galeopterus variegatus]|uniref:Disintegrin and metalloproteinase domain-containing protein 32-like n=1 Tax=Galeopterus variegatus TaxID=482537 RepID=A0ABM0S6T7_GALVR
QCGPDSCCDPQRCVLKQGSQCATGSCCQNCRFANSGHVCRPKLHRECDIPETCNGSSGNCNPDITVRNGQPCKNNQFMCFDGDCPDLDARCEEIFGTENVSVIYAYVRNTICITMDYRLEPKDYRLDPMRVKNGANCDIGRICFNSVCIDTGTIKGDALQCSQKCSGNGVCNSNNVCHCNEGFQPPSCQRRSRGSSISLGEKGSTTERASRDAGKNWLLGFYIAVPILITATIIVVAWTSLKKWFTKEEESLSSELEGSVHTYSSKSRSESSSQTDTSRSKSQGSTQTHNSSN